MSLEQLPKKPNIVLIITDQEREVQHWPEGWAEANLPARARLLEHGMHFTNAYCNSATCSPSRASLLTGLYPARHGVKTLIQYNKPKNKAQGRLPVLPPHLPNLARVLEAEGYYVVYKGKFHLSRPVKYNTAEERHAWSEADIEHMADTYGFHEWNPPDMGDPTSVSNFGGGDINNDGRFVDGSGTAAGRKVRHDEAYQQSAVGFLNSYAGDKPFCLVVSLVGPHDAQAYPGRGVTGLGLKPPVYARAGYKLAAFEQLPIDAPPTVAENISTKPSVQRAIRRLINVGIGKPRTSRQQRTHARFYAYLCKEVDSQILKVLDALDANGFTEDTLIVRTADHGELSMSHGGMVEKFYNVYQETINVPLIVSNPRLFPEGQTTESLAALVDVLPTLAALVGVADLTPFQGKDLTPVLADPAASVQDCVHFTSEDDTWPTRGTPGCIRAIVERDWKYAVYYDPYAGAAPEYEMYDLKHDPFEVINLAHPENWNPTYAEERRRLHQRLSAVMDEHGTRPPEIQWPTADDFAPEAPYKRETKRLYARDVIIEAPVQTVWDAFTDLPRLGEWNPLLTAIEGELGLGQRLQVHIAAMPAPVEATVIRYNPPFELQWLDTIPGGVITPRFGVKLEALGETVTRFVVEESFEGPLVAVAGQQLDRTMPPQYEAMCQALKARAEHLQMKTGR